MALSLDGTTGISASGNIVGNNISVVGSLSVGSFSPTTVSASGNIIGGNITTAGLITAIGNVTGGNILTAGLISATSSITSAANVVGGNITTAGLITATGNVTGGNLNTAGLVTATGNIQGGNIRTAGLISATGAITGAAITGTSLSVTGNVDAGNIRTAGLISATSNMLTAGYITATGNVLGNVFTVNLGNTTTAIVNGGGNGVGNIGSSTGVFNTVFAKATSAQYADLAEKYTADADYVPGTVLEFGGVQEVTATTTSHSPRVAGIVSTLPSYRMNDGLVSEHTAMVSLTGRVPCLVVGPIAKGDRLVTSAVVGHAQRLDPAQYEPGCIIGKALEDYPSSVIGTIEVAVGRF